MTDSSVIDGVLAAATAVRIGGTAIPGAGAALAVLDPGTGAAFTEIGTGDRAQAQRAREAAAAALPGWPATPPAERAAALRDPCCWTRRRTAAR